MADVTEAFFRGQQQAQAEQAHEQALVDSKLRQQVLRHQLSQLKLEDQLRAADLVKGRADLGLGQDGADVTQPAVTVPPSMRAGLTGGVLQRSLQQFGQGPTTGAPAAPAPAIGTAPATGTGVTPPNFQAQARIVTPADAASGTPPLVLHANDTRPATHTEMAATAAPPSAYGDAAHPGMQRAGHVFLPGLDVPELGIKVAGMWYSARAAAEEQSRRAIALKLAEQPLHNVGPEETAVARTPTGAVPVYTNPNIRGNTPQEKYIAALQKGDTATAQTILRGIRDTQRPGSIESMLLDARRRGDAREAALIDGVMKEAGTARRDPSVAADREAATADRETARTFTNDMRLYTEDVSNGWKHHADAIKVFIANPLNNLPPGEGGTGQPAPEYTPPSFEAWRAQRDATKSGGAKTVTEAELTAIARKKGTTVDVQRERYRRGGYTIGR